MLADMQEMQCWESLVGSLAFLETGCHVVQNGSPFYCLSLLSAGISIFYTVSDRESVLLGWKGSSVIPGKVSPASIRLYVISLLYSKFVFFI